jgi:hypothetical protein
VRFEQDPQIVGKKGERRTPSYVAFVLRQGRPVTRVELGPAEPIETALGDWRSALSNQRDTPAAETLRRLLWEPLARHVPTDTHTVLLAPDADRMAAIVSRSGTSLLGPHGAPRTAYLPLFFPTAGFTALRAPRFRTG